MFGGRGGGIGGLRVRVVVMGERIWSGDTY